MELNWTTFVLEIINFLALLWLLKRFLYRPVLQILAARQAGIEQQLASARDSEARATAMQQQFASRLADWEQEKAAERRRFDAELATEKERQLAKLGKELAAERERSAAQDANRLATQRRQLAGEASVQARQFASALLGRLAGPELEGRLVQLFIAELDALPEEQLAEVRAGLDGQGQGVVSTAFELPAAQRQQVSAAVASRLAPQLALEFRVDPALLSGARLSLGAWRLDFSLAGELAFFPEAASRGQRQQP
ncbi:F0F1 ATP synthase subunit delta [Vogesella oryzae]|uniref:F0F1 ATP synthase subunit delta n=1 Tax=Vogesella oryzae TaxID=1735285 RepID=UPI001583FBBA|nr:F0F1 ATP synthase subunit delta [Vogesella oryzae]